jgi:hypothetical protein
MALDFIAIQSGRQVNNPGNLLTGGWGCLCFFHFFDNGVGKL